MVLVNSQKMFLSQGQIIEGPQKHPEKRSYLNTYKPGRASFYIVDKTKIYFHLYNSFGI